MKLLIISPGKNHDHTIADGVEEYQTRLQKKFPIEWSFPTASDKDAEGRAILKLLKDSDHIILLDERGKNIDTPGFAKLIEAQILAGSKRLVFIIGGAFGVSSDVAKRADQILKLSSLVFPHMLARLILIEQVYRASSILDGGKYHHA